ncbi:2OG-Fe dioxygenase family protein [Streptomyces sp. NPDC004044]
MMLVARKDVTGGVSTLYDNAEPPVLSHTLSDLGDCIFLDDRTGLHSVSPVRVAPAAPEGYRDMFFLEFC